jgi:sugar/nucleoside kinase (ribokinase family)
MGEILVDFIVADGATSLETAKTFVARAGGAPCNAVVALARLGVPSAFCGIAGADPFGYRLRSELGAEGVDTTRLRLTDAQGTTFAYAWKDDGGDGHFWLLRGADTTLNNADVDAADVPSTAALVVGSVALAAQPSRSAIERAAETARAAGVPVVFDVNLRPSLWRNLGEARAVAETIARLSTVVKLSLDDAIGLYGDVDSAGAIGLVSRLGPLAVVLTDGGRGSWFASRAQERVTHVPAFHVDAIEPTGAGDAFTAALVTRMLDSDWSPPTAADLQYASAAGALATTRHGAWEGLPSRRQLDAFLATA